MVHRLSCPLACRILVPRPRIKPMSPALAGRFLTPGPPGKSLPCSFGLFTLEGASCHAVRMVTSRREEARSPDNSQHQFASQTRKDQHHCMCVLSCSVVSWLFATLAHQEVCSLPGSFIRGIFPLEWVVISSSRGSSTPRDLLHLLYCRWILYCWATREAQAPLKQDYFIIIWSLFFYRKIMQRLLWWSSS